MPENIERLKVYVETTVVSYLTASPSRDIVQVAHQQVTREWWERRGQFHLFVSQAVLAEAARGDVEAARRRLQALAGIPVLGAGTDVTDFAERLLRVGAIPRTAALDAIHISVAVLNGMDYLLTWNCAHIANAASRSRIERACRSAGLQPPVICTPEELMEG